MELHVAALRRRLSEVRDAATGFISSAEERLPPEMKQKPKTPPYSILEPEAQDIWTFLPEAERERADGLRTEVRQVMTDIAHEAQRSVLLDEADVRLLARCAKEMTASLRFRAYKAWGINIHHDEGAYIGMDPPGQSEDDWILPPEARTNFLDAYKRTVELTELMRPKTAIDQESRGTGPNYTLSYKPGTAFIMMWINPTEPQLADVKELVQEVFSQFHVKALRADELEHAEGITERIMEEIRSAEYLFADLTGERPSVYYEIGYAHALGKSVILYRRKGTTIHFDLAYRNCPEYDNLSDLRTKLRSRLITLTGKGSL